MNKIIKAFVVVFAVALSFVSNSCDEFDTLPLNIPFSVTVVTQGSTNPSTSSSTYCLSQSETYQDYVDDIEKLTFIEAAWRTDSVKNISGGDIELTVKVGGATIFQETLTNINPSAYQSPNAPFVFSLSATEIQALNDYLNAYLNGSNQCLEAVVKATIKSPLPVTTVYLRGIVDMVVEAETKL
jgi:hypothetical protein